MQESNKVANAKTVNGIELAVGQQWTTLEYGVVTLDNEGVSEEYPWCAKPPHISITPDGKYWDDDEEPILLECIYNPAQPKQLSPKPGDKIICNNGEEFVCCTLETLKDKFLGRADIADADFFGYSKRLKNGWMHWTVKTLNGNGDWCVKEIIPAQQGVKQEVTEVIPAQGDNTAQRALRANKSPCDVGAVFQEKTYTLEQIKEGFDALRWFDDSFKLLSGKLKETQDPEYKLYLELKAKFEDRE